MSLEFLTPAPSALARSPMERQALAAGARLERRDGWNVAVAFDGEHPERERCRTSAGFADRSHLGKVEIQGSQACPSGQATRRDDAWWCPFTPEKALVLCEPANTAALIERLDATFATVVDLTSALAALTIAGPPPRRCSRASPPSTCVPGSTPVEGFRPARWAAPRGRSCARGNRAG